MRPRDDTHPLAPGARRTAFTMAGVLYGLTTLFLAVGAVNGQNNLLFWAFGMGLGGMLVSGVFSGSGMMGLRLRRELPPTARAGEPITIRYRIRNANRLIPMFCVSITERVEKADRNSPATEQPAVAFLPHADARAEVVIEAPSRTMRRGRLRLVGVTASSAFPLGLMRKLLRFDLPGSLLVLPARLQLRDDLVPRPARRGHGGSSSPTGVGQAEEFFGVREYVAGDSPRLIAWRPSARRDELVVRQHGAPPPTVVWVILDIPAGADELEGERAIAIAGALVEMLADRGCSVGLLFDRLAVARAPAVGVWHARRLLNTLATLDLAVDRIAPGAARSAPRIRREQAAMVVHAGAANAALGPSWASHVSSGDLSSLLARGASVPDVLMPAPPRETTGERRRRLLREFFMVDPVGEPAMGDPAGVPAPGGAA